jgi:uncharacterized RDD family membrane protein YckC
MIEDAASKPAVRVKRAGFWVRAVAFGIDVLLVNAFIAVIGLCATVLTNGSVRVANTVIDVVDCVASAPPPGFPMPDGFAFADAQRCTRSLGIAHDWTLVVRERIAAGAADEDRRQVSIPLDAEGHPVRAFYLDGLIPLVLAAYLLIFEWLFGTTPAKHFFFIKVRSLGGGRINLAQAGKRLTRLLVLLPPSLGETAGPVESHQISFRITASDLDLGTWSTVLSVVALAYFISFVVATSRRTLPLHDLWASTEAVRV